MKYTNNIEKIVDLSRFALIHMGNEEDNCSKWDNAEYLIDCMIEAVNSEKAIDNEDIVYKDLRINKWKTIKNRLGDLIGYEVVEIEIDGYRCITKRINNEDEQEISERVYPYDANNRYPMQEIEAQKYLGIATAVIEDYAVEKQYCRIPMKDIEEMYNEIYGDIL